MKVIGFLVSVYILVALLLFVFQRGLLYFPTGKYAHHLPVEQYLNEGERIDVVVLNPNQQDAILYFGGNGESIVHSAVAFTDVFEQTVYFVNYRGYGGSTGQPTEQALYSDAQYIYDVIKKRHSKISVIGRSLGSGVATFLAASRPIDKMALITPYNSIQQIAQDRFPVYPMSILLKDKYVSVDRVKNIESRTLVLLAERDRVIPKEYSMRLIAAFPEHQIIVKTMPNTGHNSLSDTDEYYLLLQKFMM